MLMLVLAVNLAASPAVVLEPDAQGLPRVQPRSVGPSAQALWAVDDDAATAWRAPLEKATLAWEGPRVPGARKLEVFVRAGCQQSQEAFAAHGRPRDVVLTLERGKRAPRVEAELADVPGWQRLEVPLRGRSTSLTFSLEVKSAWPGSASAEVCVTDVRVHLDGEGKVDSSEEQLAFAQVQRAVSQRLAAPPSAATSRLPARFVTGFAPSAAREFLQEANAAPSDAAMRKEARASARALGALKGLTLEALRAQGWQRVSLDFVTADDATLEEAPRSKHLTGLPPLLSTADFKLARAAEPVDGLEPRLRGVRALAAQPLACRAACMPLYAEVSASVQRARQGCDRLCDRAQGSSAAAEARADVEQSGVFLQGSLEAPQRLLIVTSRMAGAREWYRASERTLLSFRDGRLIAAARGERDSDDVDTTLLGWNAEGTGVDLLVEVSVGEGGACGVLQRFQAAPDRAASAALRGG